jgi:uncharacterized protein involved in type VI secretion and phage assembly
LVVIEDRIPTLDAAKEKLQAIVAASTSAREFMVTDAYNTPRGERVNGQIKVEPTEPPTAEPAKPREPTQEEKERAAAKDRANGERLVREANERAEAKARRERAGTGNPWGNKSNPNVPNPTKL